MASECSLLYVYDLALARITNNAAQTRQTLIHAPFIIIIINGKYDVDVCVTRVCCAASLETVIAIYAGRTYHIQARTNVQHSHTELRNKT